MLDFEQDLQDVFFGPEFATPVRRQRPTAADIEFAAILGAADDEALDGRVLAAERTALFAGVHDVRGGDVLTTLGPAPGVPAGTSYRVLDTPRRHNDGLEREALLGSVA